MRCVLVLAFVASCGFQIPGGTSADDVAPGDADPDGMSDGMIDGMIDDGSIDTPIPIDDQDGDGVLDPQDNCVATMNADQRNHDNDLFGDACDRCPHLFSATDPDGDGDGVGDACDPRPANNADQRVVWAPFYDAGEVATWTGQGTFTVAGGYLQQATTNQTGDAPPGNVARAFVMTELVIDAGSNTNFEIGISIVNAATTRFECTVLKNGSNINARSHVTGGNDENQGWTGASLATDNRVVIRMDMATDVDCTFSQTGIADAHRDVSTASSIVGRTFVGTTGTPARFDYLFVVDEGP